MTNSITSTLFLPVINEQAVACVLQRSTTQNGPIAFAATLARLSGNISEADALNTLVANIDWLKISAEDLEKPHIAIHLDTDYDYDID